jgi:hypothetical protein
VRNAGRFTILAATVALAELAVTVSANALGGPGSDCGSASPVFSQWGDHANYYFSGNAGFESGATGWTLTGGAVVVGGNEQFNLHSKTDSHSLLIPAGGSATATVCIGLFDPELRVLAVGSKATVTVTLIPSGNAGTKAASVLDGGSFKTGSTWAPSPLISTKISSATSPVGGNTVGVRISVSGAAAQIDDLYVDPFVLKR